MGSVVFFHAHPDDEAIFTGGTMALLAERGERVVLVVATRGELGGPERVEETCRAADVLGVARVEFLRWRDSGMEGDPGNEAADAFTRADPQEAAEAVARLLREEQAAALVGYDEHGIYGHPDHVQVHRVGRRAAALAGVPTVYDATVDREYLHFVETHLVVEAGGGRPVGLGLAATDLGMPTLLVDLTIDVTRMLERKREAMAAHGSQIPETASAMRLPVEAFAAVYGYEWYLRTGPPSVLCALSAV
ncbi:MAG TPA: PIG-L family deacetylase [Acidimicrobiales bacterium]|nr:PIG-L family deacetylase [Acidimicrobiales bacterium]